MKNFELMLLTQTNKNSKASIATSLIGGCWRENKQQVFLTNSKTAFSSLECQNNSLPSELQIKMAPEPSKIYDADLRTEEVFQHFICDKKLINDDCPSIDIFNIDYFKERLNSLKEAFPEDFFLHAMALKGKSVNLLL